MNSKTKEYRQQIADAFIKSLSENPIEWKKEWECTGMVPRNAIKNTPYKGLNRFWLSYVQQQKQWDDPRWCTFNQLKEQGWHLTKGSKGQRVEYWMPYDKEKKKATTWDEYREFCRNKNPGDPDKYSLQAKYYTVFNACQIEGMPVLEKPPVHDIQPSGVISRISTSMGVPISNDGGDRAFYDVMSDHIHLPEPGAFTSDYAYNSTALHELAHSSGHPSRLNRNTVGTFGSPDYAFEELVAEISSCFMSAELPAEQTPEHIENHKAYVQSWIQEIKKQPETLMKALKEAEKAANYLDFHAGLLSKKEYNKNLGSSIEVPVDKVMSVQQQQQMQTATYTPRRYQMDKDGEMRRTFNGKLPEEFTTEDVNAFWAETEKLIKSLQEKEPNPSPIKRITRQPMQKQKKAKFTELER